MTFALVESAYALLQGEQGLVDLSPVDLSLLVLVHVVGTSLVTGKINEGYFREALFAVFESDL